MKFKRQSRGHISHDGRSNVDSSPQRSVDDDDDVDDECVDERRRVHGTSTVTSRSGSPAVDSTTTDYCSSLTAGDARTPADRSNEPSLLSSQQTSLENDETRLHCSDKPLRENVCSNDEPDHVVIVADQPTADVSADITSRVSDTTPQSSLVVSADIANMSPADTQNNLARLEIMTCIAGGNVNHCENIAGLQTPRSRRGHTGGVARSSRPASNRCDGRRARAVQSRTRSIALMAGYDASSRGTFNMYDVSAYRRGSIFNGNSVDKNCVSDFQRQSCDISRDLESTFAFPAGTYTDTTRCLYTDGRFLSDSYPANAFQQQQPFESYDNRFQSAVVRRPSSPSTLHCNVTAVCSVSDNFKPLPHPPIHSAAAASFPVCDTTWQTWKDWRWNDCARFPANAVDCDDDKVLVSGERVNWKRSIDTRGWTNDGRDVSRTSFPLNQAMDATRQSQLAAYWNGDCATEYPCTSNIMMPYYGVSGCAGTAGSKTSNCCSVPTSESSRFYDGECCYAPPSSFLSSVAAADGQELMSCQSAYQSCKYSGVVDGQYRLYTADGAPSFVNTA